MLKENLPDEKVEKKKKKIKDHTDKNREMEKMECKHMQTGWKSMEYFIVNAFSKIYSFKLKKKNP